MRRRSGRPTISIGSLVVVMAIALTIATFMPPVPAGSFTQASIDRDVDADSVADPDGVLGLDTAASVTCGVGPVKLVDVTNSLGTTVNVTIEIDKGSGNNADLYDANLVLDGGFEGDSITFSLASGTTQRVEVNLECKDVSTLTYHLNATGPSIEAIARSRTTAIVELDESWPQFGFDAAQTRSPANTGPWDSAYRRWTYGAGGAIETAATVDDDTVYLGTQNNTLLAIDEDRGPIKWSYTAGSTVQADPAVVDGTVYFGTAGGVIAAVDATTGTQEWSTDTGNNPVVTPITVADGVVYAGVDRDGLYALDASNGSTKWTFGASGKTPGGSAVDGNTAYLTESTGIVYAINVSDGSERWQHTGGGTYANPPVVDGDTVFAGDDTGKVLRAINASNGSQRWTYGANAINTPLAVEAGVVYYADAQAVVHAVDASTGTAVWTNATILGGASVTGTSVANGTVYVGDNTGTVFAIDASDGTALFEHDLDGVADEALTIAENKIYVGDATGRVYALSGGTPLRQEYTERWRMFAHDERNTGNAADHGGPTYPIKGKWTSTAGGVISGGPVVSDGVLYVGAIGDQLYAHHELNGSTIWSFNPGSGIKSTPAVDDEAVYVGTSGSTLHSVWRSNGTERWNATLNFEVVTGAGPTVVGDTVYVGDAKDTLYAFWAPNGTQRWTYTTGNDILSSPAVANGTVYVGNNKGSTVHAVDASTGTQIWTYSTTDWITSSVVVDGDRVYAVDISGVVHAVNATTGTEVWSRDITANELQFTPALAGDTLYVGDTGGTLHALNTSDAGSTVWTYSDGSGNGMKTPAFVNDYVYVADTGGTLHIVNTTDGTQDATFDLDGTPGEGLVVANYHIYIGDDTNVVYAIEET